MFIMYRTCAVQKILKLLVPFSWKLNSDSPDIVGLLGLVKDWAEDSFRFLLSFKTLPDVREDCENLSE